MCGTCRVCYGTIRGSGIWEWGLSPALYKLTTGQVIRALSKVQRHSHLFSNSFINYTGQAILTLFAVTKCNITNTINFRWRVKQYFPILFFLPPNENSIFGRKAFDSHLIFITTAGLRFRIFCIPIR